MVGYPLEGHKDAVRFLDWSPNGLEIASGSEDGTVRRWDPYTGRQVGPTIETGGWVYAIKYSPQSDTIATGGNDNMIRVWSKDGKLLIEIKGHDNWVNSSPQAALFGANKGLRDLVSMLWESGLRDPTSHHSINRSPP